MKFLIEAIVAWFRYYETPCAIYNNEGKCIGYWNTQPKERCWAHYLQDVSKISNNWWAYPFDSDGEYLGCLCFEYNEDDWEVDLEKPEWSEIITMCHFLEITLKSNENS